MTKHQCTTKSKLFFAAIGFIIGWLFAQYAYIPLKQILISWF